ncbi:MAG: hypothetical protein Q4C03_07520, partial [bacterium]|nr:hypothetical protein [bacterium]
GVDGRELRELAVVCPEYKFHLSELAEEIFKEELQLYKQSKERISDARIIYSGTTPYLRCKMDGEQLSARKISPVDACHYNNSKDVYALAAKYFGDAFGKEQEKTLSRGR